MVLGVVHCLSEKGYATADFLTSIVPCGEKIEFEAGAPGFVDEESEFKLPVADDTGIGRPAFEILFPEILDDVLLILLGEVDDSVFYAKPGREPFAGFNILLFARTEAGMFQPFLDFIGASPNLHRQADDLVSGIFEQRRRQRGVDTPRKADCDGN